MPIGKTIVTFDKYLPKLKTLDDLKLKDWLEKAQDINKTLEAMQPSEGSDGQSDENKREAMKGWFNKERFTLETKFYTSSSKRLLNANRMKAFIEECLQGKQPQHLRSVPITENNKNRIITGEQFEQVVLNGNRDYAKLILVTHPKAKKNGDVEEEFAKVQKQFNDKKLIMATYSGINESSAFKVTQKLPTILYFRKGFEQGEQPIELNRLQWFGKNKETVIKEFVNQNLNTK